MIRKFCNGCHVEVAGPETTQLTKPAIEGRRANGLGGGRPLPNGEFCWCNNCAHIAFRAVEDEQERKS